MNKNGGIKLHKRIAVLLLALFIFIGRFSRAALADKAWEGDSLKKLSHEERLNKQMESLQENMARLEREIAKLKEDNFRMLKIPPMTTI